MNAQSLLLLALSTAILPLLIQAKPNGAQRDVGNNRQPPSIEQVFSRLDVDSSGGISVGEAEGPLEGHFDQIDTDGNGEITVTELKASRAKRYERGIEMRDRIKAADTNGKGAISNEAANEAGLDKLIKYFDKIDSDGDGVITKQELNNLSKKYR